MKKVLMVFLMLGALNAFADSLGPVKEALTLKLEERELTCQILQNDSMYPSAENTNNSFIYFLKNKAVTIEVREDNTQPVISATLKLPLGRKLVSYFTTSEDFKDITKIETKKLYTITNVTNTGTLINPVLVKEEVVNVEFLEECF